MGPENFSFPVQKNKIEKKNATQYYKQRSANKLA